MATMYDDSFSTTTFRERDVKENPIIAIGTNCPVTSRQPKRKKLLNSTPEWEWRTMPSPRTTGMVEGTAPTGSDAETNLSYRYMLKGRFIKQFRYVEMTKESMRMVRQYTVSGDPWQDQINFFNLQLHRDLEATSLADTESVPPTDGSVASTTRGIARWLSNTDSRFTDSATTPDATVRTPTGSISLNNNAAATTVTEANVRSILASIASARFEDSTKFLGVCTPNMRSAFTSFSLTDKSGSSSTNFPLRRWNMPDQTIEARVTKYNSDFGPIDIITSFLLNAGATSPTLALFLDMGNLEIALDQPVEYQELFNDGVKKRGLLDTIFVQTVLNPQAHGIVTTRSTY